MWGYHVLACVLAVCIGQQCVGLLHAQQPAAIRVLLVLLSGHQNYALQSVS